MLKRCAGYSGRDTRGAISTSFVSAWLQPCILVRPSRRRRWRCGAPMASFAIAIRQRPRPRRMWTAGRADHPEQRRGCVLRRMGKQSLVTAL